jgi:hypothetical protein
LDIYASDFPEIPVTSSKNAELRAAVEQLIRSEPIPGKALEGGNRLDAFRNVLLDLANGRLTLEEAYAHTERALPRASSPHADSNKVFAQGWGERLVRTQLSQFYNRAAMEKLRAAGYDRVFVPHSKAEKADSPCSQGLAGANQDLPTLYDRLIANYRDGKFSDELKIPHHPHCTHTVKPPQ